MCISPTSAQESASALPNTAQAGNDHAGGSNQAVVNPGAVSVQGGAQNTTLDAYLAGGNYPLVSGAGPPRGCGQVFHARCVGVWPPGPQGSGRGHGAPSPGSSRDNPLFIMSSPGLSPESPFVLSPSSSPQPPPIQQPVLHVVQQIPAQQIPVQQLPVQQLSVQQPPAPEPIYATVVTLHIVQQIPTQQTPVQQTPVQQLPVQQLPAPEPTYTMVVTQKSSPIEEPKRTFATIGMQTCRVFLLSALSSPAFAPRPPVQINNSDSSPSLPSRDALLPDVVDGSDEEMPASILPLKLPGLSHTLPAGAANPIPINLCVRSDPASPTPGMSRKRRAEVVDHDSAGSTPKWQCSVKVPNTDDEEHTSSPPYLTRSTPVVPPAFLQVSPNIFPTPAMDLLSTVAIAARGDGADPPAIPSPSFGTAGPTVPSPSFGTVTATIPLPSASSVPARLKKTPAPSSSRRTARLTKTTASNKGKGKEKMVELFDDSDMFAEDAAPPKSKPVVGIPKDEFFAILFTDKRSAAASTPCNKRTTATSMKKTTVGNPSNLLSSPAIMKTLDVRDVYSTSSDFAPISSLLVSLALNEPIDIDAMFPDSPSPPAEQAPSLSSLNVASHDDDDTDSFADGDFDDPSFLEGFDEVMDDMDAAAAALALAKSGARA